MDSIRERVAEAIGKTLDKTPWQDCGQGFKEACLDAADAAIAEYRRELDGGYPGEAEYYAKAMRRGYIIP